MVCRYIRNLLSITSLLLVGLNCAFMNCMDDEDQGPKLPVLDRDFFGLAKKASASKYHDYLRLFAQALAAQERLARITRDLIQVEAQIQQIEAEWYLYRDEHLQSMLAKDALDPFNRSRIGQYLSSPKLVLESLGVPIVGTTPRANATILMCRNFIQSARIPKSKIPLISCLVQSDNDEVEFIGRFLRHNVFINCKNAKHDSISDQHDKALAQMQDCLNLLKCLKCTSLDEFLFAGRELLEREGIAKKALQHMRCLNALKKEQLDRINSQTHAFQQSIICRYQPRKQMLDQLYLSIVEKLQETDQLVSHRTKESKKEKGKTRNGSAASHEGPLPCMLDSGLANVGSDEIDEPDFACDTDVAGGESACMNNASIVEDEPHDPNISAAPSASAHIQEQPDLVWGHHDEYISTEESCPEYTVIYDRLNNMRICLYSPALTHPVDRDLVRIPLDYMRHIADWFTDHEHALVDQGYKDNTSDKFVPEEGRFNIIRIHRFSRHVDRFIYKKGIQTRTPSRRVQGQMDICITIPGHVEFLDVVGRPQSCVFVYLIDSVTKRCYHRNIEYKPEGRLTQEFLEQGCFNVNLPPVAWVQK